MMKDTKKNSEKKPVEELEVKIFETELKEKDDEISVNYGNCYPCSECC
ncbi:MAG: hypothetical protein JEZ08_17665 [Clostridiales bacterium]|nr:hypothetical protein [Clostridiales bacterium]